MRVQNLKENLLKILKEMKSSVQNNTDDIKTTEDILKELVSIINEISSSNPNQESVFLSVFQIEELVDSFYTNILPTLNREFPIPPYFKIRELRRVIQSNMPELLE